MNRLSAHNSLAQDLCLACGLCCNGVLFADLKLQRGDDPARLQGLGIRLVAAGPKALRSAKSASASISPKPKFLQPCSAWQDCRCQIYPDRPRYCREFECVLLRSVNARRLRKSAALRIIASARERADRVMQLLRELGDTDEDRPLRARFQRTTKRLERIGADKHTAAIYGDLTLAVHDLNCLLSEAFFPGLTM